MFPGMTDARAVHQRLKDFIESRCEHLHLRIVPTSGTGSFEVALVLTGPMETLADAQSARVELALELAALLEDADVPMRGRGGPEHRSIRA